MTPRETVAAALTPEERAAVLSAIRRAWAGIAPDVVECPGIDDEGALETLLDGGHHYQPFLSPVLFTKFRAIDFRVSWEWVGEELRPLI